MPGLFTSITDRRRRLADARAMLTSASLQARHAALFMEAGVSDSAEGRFAMQALHLLLIVRRLRRESGCEALAQALVNLFMSELDAALREMGVGDLAVPRQMKFLARSFFAAAPRLDLALDQNAPGDAFKAVFDALPGLDGPTFDGAAMIRRLRACDQRLSEVSVTAVRSGADIWPEALA